MLEWLREQIQSLLGLGRDVQDLNAIQTVLRALVVYLFTLTALRLGSRRFLSRPSAMDVVVAIMLGSVMSGAIRGSTPFGPTLLSGAALIAMHWLLAALAVRLDWLGPLVKGRPVVLIRDGQVERRAMHDAGITGQDLAEALRVEARETDPSRIQLAYLERSGRISVIPATRAPRILDVSVEDGIQIVRITLE